MICNDLAINPPMRSKAQSERGRRLEVFTPIRSAVAACLLDGMTFKGAAAAIGCSEKTVCRHVNTLYRLLGLKRLVGTRSQGLLIAELAMIAAERP